MCIRDSARFNLAIAISTARSSAPLIAPVVSTSTTTRGWAPTGRVQPRRAECWRAVQPHLGHVGGQFARPNLDVVRTQRCGRAVTSTVLIALPDGTTPTTVDTHTSPGRLAEPAVADALVSLTGTAAHASWTWTVHDANNVVIATVALSDLGLEPILLRDIGCRGRRVPGPPAPRGVDVGTYRTAPPAQPNAALPSISPS